MITELLNSKPKTNLINLFLANPKRAFSFTELRAESGCAAALLKTTLKELEKMDFLLTIPKNKVKYYQMNRHFALYPELLNLLRRVKKIPVDLLAKSAAKFSECKVVAITGLFTGKPRLETDLLFVGKVGQKKLNIFLKLAEKYAEQEVNFTIFSIQEFEYRKIMNDRFVKNIMENEPVLVIDRLKQKKSIAKLVYKFNN